MSHTIEDGNLVAAITALHHTLSDRKRAVVITIQTFVDQLDAPEESVRACIDFMVKNGKATRHESGDLIGISLAELVVTKESMELVDVLGIVKYHHGAKSCGWDDVKVSIATLLDRNDMLPAKMLNALIKLARNEDIVLCNNPLLPGDYQDVFYEGTFYNAYYLPESITIKPRKRAKIKL